MQNQDYRAIFDEALKSLHEEYKARNEEDRFRLWFNINYVKSSPGVITASVSSDFILRQMIDRAYIKAIEEKMRDLSGQAIQISAVVNPKRPASAASRQKASPGAKANGSGAASSPPQTSFDFSERPPHPQLNKDFTFDKFVVGENNLYSYSMCVAAAKNPGTSYNPILLYGGVGLGKTHLMQSIGAYIYENPPKENMKIVYISAENFLNEFTSSLRTGTTDKFKKKYRSLDVLLLDDIHFLKNKESTQDEFFYTFEELKQKNSQIVLTCDRPLRDLNGFPERLISRFSEGITLNLKAPSYEERRAILMKKLALKNKSLPSDVVDFIAKNIQSNVRELIGCLEKVLGYKEIMRKDVTVEDARHLLVDNFARSQEDAVSIAKVQRVVAAHYNLKAEDLVGKKRTKNVSRARHIAIYLARKITNNTYSEIGSAFGGRDHSSIMYSDEIVKNAIRFDTELRETVDLLESEVKGGMFPL